MNFLQENNVEYELFAVLVHKGSDLNTGHCIAYVVHGDDWWLFDDKVKVLVFE